MAEPSATARVYVEGVDRIRERDRPTRVRVRCGSCARLLGEVLTAPWQIRCPRCKEMNVSA
jgi:bacterioferritin-associated ferredoxin